MFGFDQIYQLQYPLQDIKQAGNAALYFLKMKDVTESEMGISYGLIRTQSSLQVNLDL